MREEVNLNSPVRIALHPAGSVLQIPAGAPLRDHLFEHGIEFPCGGRGRCKGCRIRVLEGHLRIHQEERRLFSEAELDQGWRLACLAHATGDLKLEMAQWEASILSDTSRFDFQPRAGFGIAVDLGTTTIVAQLLNLQTGDVLGVNSALNAQAQHGADIMSRIEFALAGNGQATLEQLIREQVGGMASRLVSGAGLTDPNLTDVVLVGNTVMHHLFCGISVEPLSHYPFEPVEPGLRVFESTELGWTGFGAGVRFLPCLGGFVGSDILAGILATGMHRNPALTALMDLGTNGEIVVGNFERLLCASTAAGPAFEGARISMGMRAATGAISEVSIADGKLSCSVLGNTAPRGICGSGLVDAVSAGLDLKLVGPNGRIRNGDALPLLGNVSLSQWDIRELQMAKGAIAAGLRILLRESGATAADLEALYLAGAFGNYINLASGRRIGLLNLPAGKIQPAGNTALLGAKLALFDPPASLYADVLSKIRHVSLNESEGFQDIYVDEMSFS